MLDVIGYNAFYGDVQVLWDVNLHVGQGEVVALIGPNGAGKTTLLQTLMGLARGAGTANFNGADASDASTEQLVRRGLSLVPEGGRVFPEMTCRDNLLTGGHVLGSAADRRQSLRMVETLFPRLADRAGQKASTLSGGERQMLALGRALMARPKMLLLDEPSLGLHPLMATLVFEAIGRINRQGVTVLLVEQKVSFALEMSSRAYVLEKGRIALQGPSAELAHDEHVRKAYLAV